METMILIAQTGALVFITAWIVTGVVDNLLHPAVNETYTAQVVSMSRMAEEFPDDFALVAYRAVHNRQIQLWFFRTAVAAELVATVMCCVGVVAMLMAINGTLDADQAKALALLGALLFTAVWAGFLVLGNYFCYWYCHEGSQMTHYHMTIWGVVTMILIAAA